MPNPRRIWPVKFNVALNVVVPEFNYKNNSNNIIFSKKKKYRVSEDSTDLQHHQIWKYIAKNDIITVFL